MNEWKVLVFIDFCMSIEKRYICLPKISKGVHRLDLMGWAKIFNQSAISELKKFQTIPNPPKYLKKKKMVGQLKIWAISSRQIERVRWG